MIERLNSLLRVELAAVAGYQRALGAVRKKALADGEEILRLAAEHQRTVAVLQESVQARGGAPEMTADAWEGSGVPALISESALMRLESPDFIAALLEAEKRGLVEYEASLDSLDESARELLERELIPRQRRHVTALSAMLASLAA